MSYGPLSSMTKTMIEAAKADAPSAAVRAKLWAQVSGAVGAAGAAGAASGTAAAAGAGTAKLLAAGALFGGAVTVGLAVTVLRVVQVPTSPRPATAPAAVTPTTSLTLSLDPATFDPLAREAQLVSEARGALGRGDPRRALEAVRAARALPLHQLAPEELAVESQALRALGRASEATQVDDALRSQFPESALAR